MGPSDQQKKIVVAVVGIVAVGGIVCALCCRGKKDNGAAVAEPDAKKPAPKH